MRVAYFIAYPQRMSGANQVLFNLITRLPPTVRPVVIITAEGNVAEAYRRAGIEPMVLTPGESLQEFGGGMWTWSPLKQVIIAVRRLLPYTLRLCFVIRRIQPDIVHINDLRGAVLAGPAAYLMRRPIVAHLHGEITYTGTPVKLFERLPTAIISVCSAIQRSLGFAARAKAVTVYNGARDIAPSAPISPWLTGLHASGVKIVCCFASVVPFKGHHHLLNAVAILNRRGGRDQALFVCVGDLVAENHVYWTWLMRRQRELGISNLLFTGWQKEPYSFYRLATLTVLPSANYDQFAIDDMVVDVRGGEGFPMANLEAMSFGVPVVATNNAGASEQVVHGETGFIVPVGDDEALADSIEMLLGDSDLCDRMGRAGRARVQEHFMPDKTVDGVLRVYDAVLARRHPADRHTKEMAPRRRILYYIAYPVRMAGAATSLRELIIHLPKYVEPLVVVAAEGLVAQTFRAAGVQTIVMSPGESLLEFGGEPLKWALRKYCRVLLFQQVPHTWRLWRLIRRERIDIVHVNDIRGGVLAGVACRLARCPMVGHLRGEVTLRGIWPYIFERASTRIITVCASIQSSLSAIGRDKAVTVYNGISGLRSAGSETLPWIESMRKRGVTVVCCFASVVPFKGHFTLLDAVNILNGRGWKERFAVVCVGDLPADPDAQKYWTWLFRRQATLGVDNMSYTGWRSNVSPFYRTCDLSVLASANRGVVEIDGVPVEFQGGEGFPRTHLEAMWFGIPVVSTDTAGVREQILSGETGLIVPQADPNALADALERLMVDPRLRKRMGQAGRQRVEHSFSASRHVDGVMRVYDELVAAS